MKLHDLRPAEGSPHAQTPRRSRHRRRQGQDRGPRHEGPEGPRRRLDPGLVRGRPDAAPHADPEAPWLQEPVQVDYEVVNVGEIAGVIERGASRPGEPAGRRAAARRAPITVNQDVLRDAGLIRTLDKPLKVLGDGRAVGRAVRRGGRLHEIARPKIEAAGGTVKCSSARRLSPRPRRRARGRRPRRGGRAEDEGAHRASAGARARPRQQRPPAPPPRRPRRRGRPGGERGLTRTPRKRASDEDAAEAGSDEPEVTANRRGLSLVFESLLTRSAPRTSVDGSSSSSGPDRLPVPRPCAGAGRRPGQR